MCEVYCTMKIVVSCNAMPCSLVTKLTFRSNLLPPGFKVEILVITLQTPRCYVPKDDDYHKNFKFHIDLIGTDGIQWRGFVNMATKHNFT
jgi:hypothetical protein